MQATGARADRCRPHSVDATECGHHLSPVPPDQAVRTLGRVICTRVAVGEQRSRRALMTVFPPLIYARALCYFEARAAHTCGFSISPRADVRCRPGVDAGRHRARPPQLLHLAACHAMSFGIRPPSVVATADLSWLAAAEPLKIMAAGAGRPVRCGAVSQRLSVRPGLVPSLVVAVSVVCVGPSITIHVLAQCEPGPGLTSKLGPWLIQCTIDRYYVKSICPSGGHGRGHRPA